MGKVLPDQQTLIQEVFKTLMISFKVEQILMQFAKLTFVLNIYLHLMNHFVSIFFYWVFLCSNVCILAHKQLRKYFTFGNILYKTFFSSLIY